MSNELRSVHEIPPDIASMDMGLCVDCNEPWSMTSREWADWDDLVKRKGLHWPKRCKSCRTEKRGQQPKVITIFDISEMLKVMAEKAVNEEYEGDSDHLAQELTDVITKLSTFMDQRRK